ncbi:hypothetical protein L195_g011895, partial [Trifolium pratense]
MEDSEAVDDQNSGWFQVKKKHRNVSKFSLQSWMGGFSGKNASSSQRKQQSAVKKEVNSHGKQKTHGSRSGENFLQSPVPASVASSLSVSKEEVATSSVNTSVVRPKNEIQKSEPEPLISTDSQGKHEDAKKLDHTDKTDVAQKPKWGDIEEGCLALPPHENLIGVGIKFGSIGDDSLPSCRKQESTSNQVDSYHAQEKDSTASSIGAETVSDQNSSLRCEDEILGENSKGVKNISLEHSNIQEVNEENIGPEDDTLHCDNKNEEANEAATDCGVNDEHLSANDVANQAHSLINVATDITNTEMAEQNCSLRKVVPSSQVLEVFSESTSVEEVKDQPDGNVENVASGSHNMDALEEGDSNESKERFRQRLWCFLFENLNRSVDELYLLCELECDLEQMKEAILVLQESASDFQELITRVEEFEK